MQKDFIKFTFVAILFLFLAIPVFANISLAQSIQAGSWNVGTDLSLSDENTEGLSGKQEDVASRGVLGLISRAIKFITSVVGSLSILMFIIGGVMMIVYSNNEEGLSRGKDIVTVATIGLVIVFMAYLIVKLLEIILYAE